MSKRRTALVTGGGRGIGAAVARALAEAGTTVVVSARSSGEIEAVAAGLRDAGHTAHALPCDVTDEAQVEGLARAATDAAGPVDILINNAGASMSAPLHRTTLADWERMLAVNATGAFLCTRAFLPGMRERGWGRIVTVASIAGLSGARYIAAYTASKHAAVGLMRAAAAETAGTGITVNAVCPGYVDTPMTEQSIRNVMARTGTSRDDALGAILGAGGQDRLITPEEVAAAVVSLCRDDAASTTGEAIVLGPGEVP